MSIKTTDDAKCKQNKYRNYKIPKEKFDSEKDLHLETTYELCIAELSAQQTKRDQIIAFYIALISFVVPSLISLNTTFIVKGIGFIFLFFIGGMLSFVTQRYRIYKEIYWITSRVISQLYNFKNGEIDKDLVQSLFYKCMCKNVKSVVVYKTDKAQNIIEPKSVNRLKSYKKILSSAETILYCIIILTSSLLLGIGLFIILSGYCLPVWFCVVVSLTAGLFVTVSFYAKFCNTLIDVYKTLIDGSDDSFNAAYHKAWFLHFDVS